MESPWDSQGAKHTLEWCEIPKAQTRTLKNARLQVFGLLSAGFRGLSGTGPEVAKLEYTTFILPTLTYGLEALVMEPKEIKKNSIPSTVPQGDIGLESIDNECSLKYNH